MILVECTPFTFSLAHSSITSWCLMTTQPHNWLSLFSNGSEFTVLRGLRGDKGLQSQHWPGKRLAESNNGICGGQGSKMVPKIPASATGALYNPVLLSGATPRNKIGFHRVPENEISYTDIKKGDL